MRPIPKQDAQFHQRGNTRRFAAPARLHFGSAKKRSDRCARRTRGGQPSPGFRKETRAFCASPKVTLRTFCPPDDAHDRPRLRQRRHSADVHASPDDRRTVPRKTPFRPLPGRHRCDESERERRLCRPRTEILCTGFRPMPRMGDACKSRTLASDASAHENGRRA